ncbi:AAA family ATPase [Bibersteinia trehalosi]|uniref:AAA family ATPase n=1 Tax=Bibersteinia trehalosi TaxID=47735 RepID=UPI0007DAA7BE|nr:AAA family ATPase [Bibersteinia trehalosi]
MQLSPLAWQDLTVQHTFAEHTHSITFFDFQPNATQALKQFILADFGSLLVLKTETLPAFLTEIQAFCSQHSQSFLLKNEANQKSLFGYAFFRAKENKIETVSGAVEQINGKILILPVATLLNDIALWDKLKSALLFGQYEARSENALPVALEPIQSQFKLLLLGSRDDIALLAEYDEDLYQVGHYAEIQSYLNISDNLEKWADYVRTAAQQNGLRLSERSLNQLLRYYVRESEDRSLISISPALLQKHLQALRQFYSPHCQLDNIQGYFDYIEQQAAVLHQYALQDILKEQLYLETDDEEIGQINGLSVVEFNGVPQSFGEPLRISCNVQYGDGEIHDIERKVELGGNIHSKGILIAQSCLANLLELPTQLPFSASLAFEQSYGEIDGDSSALAIFCVLMSSLSKLALPQSIAVTGSIDQFGNVLSVGGVNQKIEGFFQVCQARGLTGKQGVIIPKVCLSHLSLNQAVISAVKNEQFAIWAVEDVFEALEILLNRSFYDEENVEIQQPSLFTLVHQYIDEQQHMGTSGSFWQKICKIFN